MYSVKTRHIRQPEALEHLLQILDAQKEKNTTTCLCLFVSENVQPDPKAAGLLLDVLSHPNAKVCELQFVETTKKIGLAPSDVMKPVRRWCEQTAGTVPRTITLQFGQCPVLAFEELRDILTLPGNRVQKLTVLSDRPSAFESFLRPVLVSPDNEVKTLEIVSTDKFTVLEGRSLSLGLASSNCKLRTLEVEFFNDSKLETAVAVTDGIFAAQRLENLVWSDDTRMHSIEEDETLVRKLSRLMERPGNRLLSLKLTRSRWNGDNAKILADALTSEHCRVETLVCPHAEEAEGEYDLSEVFLPVIFTLQHPNNRLQSLTIRIQGSQSAIALENSLNDPNCKLESLSIARRFGWADGNVVIAIANALRTSTSNRLKHLAVGRQPAFVFRALSDSLRSSCNQLTELNISLKGELDDATAIDFNRAVRGSNVRILDRGISGPFLPFSRALGAPFFQLLITLLSVKLISRLGKEVSVRILPLQDLIPQIAQTLGWPLGDLRCAS